MNDFDYDILERKRVARNAKYKRNGSKSRKCTLPQDSMSAAQLRRMNGKMETYNLSKPMSWTMFRAMPDDLKREYITRLRERFNASLAKISEMMGICRPNVSREVIRLGIDDGIKRLMSAVEILAWDEWCRSTGEPASEEPVQEPEGEAEEKSVEPKTNAASTNEQRLMEMLLKPLFPANGAKKTGNSDVVRGQLCFSGDIDSIAERLVAFLGTGTYNVRVEFVREKEGGEGE